MKHILPIFLALLLAGCAAPPAETVPDTLPVPSETVAPATVEPVPIEMPEDSLLASMTLREKVGQLFLIRPEAVDPEGLTDPDHRTTAVTAAMLETLKTYPVGGFVQFTKNIESPQQLLAFNQALLTAVPVAPFLSVDEEGGLVARLASHPAFDLPTYRSAGAVGALPDPEAALDMGRTIGGYLQDYGFNMDFAPVADVNTNPDNPIIGTRSFSPDPEHAARCAGDMAEGLRPSGIVPVFKHFPGHGDTAQDSHKGLAVSYRTAEDMEGCEWLPFRQAGSQDCVMVGHIALPQVTGDMTPATLSPAIVTGLLRGQLGFEGLIITDALDMGAITQDYSSGQAALEALNAGCDLLLMPQSLPQAFDAVMAAVEDGSFPEAKLDQIVLRILRFKLDQGILKL